MMAEDLVSEKKAPKRREGRSPAYPFFSVLKALERAQELYGQEAAHSAPLISALRAWNYSPKSSGGRQTLATMRYYGLIEVAGEGDARMIKVSEIARKILLDKREDDSERRALIRQVALMPSAHKMLYQKYPDGLPSDGTVHHYLVFERGFNDDAANDVLAEFKQTASQIQLYQSGYEVDKIDENDHIPQDELTSSVKFGGASIGDLVQWEIGGVLQMETPMRVRLVTEDGQWIAVEGSETGIPMDQVTVLEHASAPVAAAPRFAIETPKPKIEQDAALAEGWKEERLIDDGGEEIFIRYRGDPTPERYTYIRDYLDFKLGRMKKP